MNDYLPVQIGIAFVLDILVGDPRWFPHPVRMIGVCIEYCERILRKLIPSERMAGVFLAFIDCCRYVPGHLSNSGIFL